MADNTFDSDGTELFLSLNGSVAIQFDCPTAITGLGFTATERTQSCLNSTISNKRAGKRELNAFQVPFRLIAGSQAHQYLMSLFDDATANLEIPYAIALTDGTSDPALVSGSFVAPGSSPNWTRTVAVGDLQVSALTIDFNDGEDVMGSFTALPMSVKWYYKV